MIKSPRRGQSKENEKNSQPSEADRDKSHNAVPQSNAMVQSSQQVYKVKTFLSK